MLPSSKIKQPMVVLSFFKAKYMKLLTITKKKLSSTNLLKILASIF